MSEREVLERYSTERLRKGEMTPAEHRGHLQAIGKWSADDERRWQEEGKTPADPMEAPDLG